MACLEGERGHARAVSALSAMPCPISLNVGMRFGLFLLLTYPVFPTCQFYHAIWGKQFLLPLHHYQHTWHISSFFFKHLVFFPHEKSQIQELKVYLQEVILTPVQFLNPSRKAISHWEVINQLFYCQHFLPAHLLMWTPCTVTWPICTLSSSKTHSTSMHMQQS